MEKLILRPDTIAAILRDSVVFQSAQLAKGEQSPPKEVEVLESFSLTTARERSAALPFNFPFRSVYAFDGSDSSTYVYLVPWVNDTLQAPIKIKVNDSWSIPGGFVNKCFLYWPAQSGKSISLAFFHSSEFRSGSFTSVSAGGVSISEGSVVGATTTTTLAAATAAAIAAQNFSRKVLNIYNDTGADIFLSGASTVTNSGSTKGIPLASGGVTQWKNTGILYAYSVAGGAVLTMEET